MFLSGRGPGGALLPELLRPASARVKDFWGSSGGSVAAFVLMCGRRCPPKLVEEACCSSQKSRLAVCRRLVEVGTGHADATFGALPGLRIFLYNLNRNVPVLVCAESTQDASIAEALYAATSWEPVRGDSLGAGLWCDVGLIVPARVLERVSTPRCFCIVEARSPSINRHAWWPLRMLELFDRVAERAAASSTPVFVVKGARHVLLPFSSRKDLDPREGVHAGACAALVAVTHVLLSEERLRRTLAT